MKHCEIDIETRGKRPGCVVLSLGACCFDADSVGETFYTVFSHADQAELGAHADPDTTAWWLQQSVEARQVLDEANAAPHGATITGLVNFSEWWKRQGAQFVWGNGAAFDDPILTETFRLFGMTPPWKFWDSRCHRTLRALFPQIKAPPFEGTKHRADADAAHQALHASRILKYVALREKGFSTADAEVELAYDRLADPCTASTVDIPLGKGLVTDAASEDLGAALARIRKEKQ